MTDTDHRSRDVWDSERLEQIGTIMNRYAEHVRVGHRLRLGIEGDPCNTYRSADDAPRGEVVSVQTEDNGYVGFNVRLDDGELIQVDNRTVDPRRTWEIDPPFLKRFTEDAVAGVSSDAVDASDRRFRGELQSKIDSLSDHVQRLEDTEFDFRKTTTATIRHLVADLLSLTSGRPPSFAAEYADKYDLAMTDDFKTELPSRAVEADVEVDARGDGGDGETQGEGATYGSGTRAPTTERRRAYAGHSRHDDKAAAPFMGITSLRYDSPELHEAAPSAATS